MLGNFTPYYVYQEVIGRQGPPGETYHEENRATFMESNLTLSRMDAFRYAQRRAHAFAMMKSASQELPINRGESEGFELSDTFRFEIWLEFGESDEDSILVWDSSSILDSIDGSVIESSLLEMLFVPGANPAKPDYNPA